MTRKANVGSDAFALMSKLAEVRQQEAKNNSPMAFADRVAKRTSQLNPRLDEIDAEEFVGGANPLEDEKGSE